VYSSYFWSYRKNVGDKARHYLTGLLHNGDKKNCEHISEIIDGADDQALLQFLSDSKWDDEGLKLALGKDIADYIGGKKQNILIIDETSFKKKGKNSVGVAPQYLGSEGKIENGQVGVFSALCYQNRSLLTNNRLFMPEEWISDKKRCLRQKMPESEIVFKTKNEIAVDLIKWHKENKIDFGWVVADAAYGRGFEVIDSVIQAKKKFVIDIKCNTHVFLKKPKWILPKTENGRGRKAIHKKPDLESISVEDFSQITPKSGWRSYKIRNGSKKVIRYSYFRQKVWLIDNDSKKQYELDLILRNCPDGEVKYSLTNAKGQDSLKDLAIIQSQRFFIEKNFRDAKQSCGMKDYQVRNWKGWHRHMLLSMLALSFIEKAKDSLEDEIPDLTPRDIEELLDYYIPRKRKTEADVIKTILNRHKKRKIPIKKKVFDILTE